MHVFLSARYLNAGACGSVFTTEPQLGLPRSEQKIPRLAPDHLIHQDLANRCFSSSHMIRLFEETAHAAKYAAFRPTYPESVFSAIYNFCKEAESPFQSAVDVGCGSGQSTFPLKEKFSDVLGLDVSKAQIDKAPKGHAGLRFKVGPAEDLSFIQTDSIDLVTVAQAIHWLDVAKFYAEVKRVLKPHTGVLVAYGYGNIKLDNKQGTSLVSKFYGETLKGYWDPHRGHIDNHLQSFQLPFQHWQRDDSLELQKKMTLNDLIGYLSTWSGYREYMKQHPGSKVMQELQDRLAGIYAVPDTESTNEILATWPLFLLLGKMD